MSTTSASSRCACNIEVGWLTFGRSGPTPSEMGVGHRNATNRVRQTPRQEIVNVVSSMPDIGWIGLDRTRRISSEIDTGGGISGPGVFWTRLWSKGELVGQECPTHTLSKAAPVAPPRHPSDIVFGMKPILLEIVNRLSETGARLGALEAALVHTRQLTTGDIERLLGAHKANIDSQLATLRTSIAALPE